ncbi:MAG: hypothetical protein ACK57R_10840 [Dolichospermum sp.]
MEEHKLSLSDLPQIGSSETIQAILTKEKALTFNQIKQLAERFQVNIKVFLN